MLNHNPALTPQGDIDDELPLFKSRALAQTWTPVLRAYEALVVDFALLYPVSDSSDFTEFDLGSAQTFRIIRAENDLVFEVIYSDPTCFADLTGRLEAYLRRCREMKPLRWHTVRITSSSSLLKLPRNPDEALTPEAALASIFHLDLGNDAERERRVIACIQAFYPPGNGFESTETSNASLARTLLAAWLSLQHISGALDVTNPEDTATMLISMMFAALGNRFNSGLGLPDRAALLSFLRECVRLFIRGCLRRD